MNIASGGKSIIGSSGIRSVVPITIRHYGRKRGSRNKSKKNKLKKFKISRKYSRNKYIN
jgi:hypothetical protein